MPLGFGSEYRRRAVLCSKRKTGAQHAGAGWGGGRDHCGGGETTEDRPWSVATTRVPHHQPQRTPGPSEPPSCGWGWSQTSGVGGDWAASSPALSKPPVSSPSRAGAAEGTQKLGTAGPRASSFRLSERGEACGCPALCPWPGVGCPLPIHSAHLPWPPGGQYWVSVQVGHSSWVSGSSHWVSQPLSLPVSRTLFLTQQGAPLLQSPAPTPSLHHLFQAAQGLAGCCPQWAGQAWQGVTLGLESDMPDG